MESDMRVFVASSELFSDFQCNISLYNIETIDDIINEFKNRLSNVLVENHLTKLNDELSNKKFHIHGYTIEEILTSEKDNIFFICDHH
tara:strand:+ start:1734 stop:1997 length:264 start_codon:yes stop_codon:yes gene_type:complete